MRIVLQDGAFAAALLWLTREARTPLPSGQARRYAAKQGPRSSGPSVGSVFLGVGTPFVGEFKRSEKGKPPILLGVPLPFFSTIFFFKKPAICPGVPEVF